MTMTSNQTPTRLKSKKKKNNIGLKLFFTFMLFIALGVAGYAAYVYFQLDNAINGASSGNTKTIPDSEKADAKPLTVLLLGLDSRTETGTMLTDVIMIASLNPKTKAATIVSIPRDTYMQVEGFSKRKANSYYAKLMAKEIKAEAETDIKNLFGRFLDVHIDYLSVVNFDAFKDVVDELGGVDVNVDMDMRYVDTVDGTNINLEKGQQTLDGQKALDFVRYRKSNRGTGASSDLERNQRQQQVIRELVNNMKSLNGLTSIGGIFEAVGNNVHTDIPSEQLKSFIWTYKGINNDNIEYVPLEGTWESPYLYINKEQLAIAKTKLQNRLTVSP